NIAAVSPSDNNNVKESSITRLLLSIKDAARVDDAEIKRLGASRVVKLNKQTIQLIDGAKAETISE
ncbi:PTS N-acetyl glucosamine transporter subunit IIABC, partial [Erwinia amylovora]|nr:PTS N-acetyl glucosamine transporter subunit IIABC [Erwinia amylovora]